MAFVSFEEKLQREIRFTCAWPPQETDNSNFICFWPEWVEYTDARDVGLCNLTHFYLLIGCAMPVWFHVDYMNSSTAFDVVCTLTGVIILGVGDTMVRKVVGSCRLFAFVFSTCNYYRRNFTAYSTCIKWVVSWHRRAWHVLSTKMNMHHNEHVLSESSKWVLSSV